MDTHFQRIDRLPPYVFNIIGDLKQAARARGEDIIDFGMGNPDQPTPSHIVDKLREAALGKMVMSAKLTEVLATALRKPERAGSRALASLTSRELEILKLIAKGMSNKLIARELDISDGTVKVHVKHFLKKLNLRSRVEAAVWMVNHQKGA